MTKREACEERACQRVFGYSLADVGAAKREVCRDVVKDIYAELAEPDEAMVLAGEFYEGTTNVWQAMLRAAAGGGGGQD